MKAFRAEAEWSPREGFIPTQKEIADGRVCSGSRVYRNPRLRMVDMETPRPKSDELLLKIRYCGICGSDTHVYETDPEGYVIFSGPTRLPSVLGHEYTGEVVEVGADVEGFTLGDIVTGESVLWCGKCLPCKQGMLNQCENVELMGLTYDGAFAEYMAIDSKYCYKLNGLVDRFPGEELYKVGALVEPLGCAYNGIYISGGGILPGAFAVVYGAGPIGLGAVGLLRESGAAKIIALDIVDARLDIALELGADHVFNPTREDGIVERIRELTGGWGADIQVEAAGAARRTLSMIERLYARRGKLIYLGRADSYGTIDLNSVVSGAYAIIGSRGHSGYGIFPNIIKMLEGGRLRGVEKMVTSVYGLDEARAAFEASTRRADGKILIRVG